jgi:hypothetical protein
VHEVYSLEAYRRRGVKVDISEACDYPYHNPQYVLATTMGGNACTRCTCLVYLHPSTGGRWWGRGDLPTPLDAA